MTFFMYVFTQANAAEMGRTVICVGSGNEGSSGGHLSGSLLEEPEAGRLEYNPCLRRREVGKLSQAAWAMLWRGPSL